jgi:hypothetical protein
MRDPSPEKLMAWWRSLLAKWKKGNERFYLVDADGRMHEEGISFENATHFSCIPCSNVSGIQIAELSEAGKAIGMVPYSAHVEKCMIRQLWFKVDHQQRQQAHTALTAQLGEHMLSHIVSDERLERSTRYGLHVQRSAASTVTYLVDVSDDDAIVISQADDIPDPDCEICEMLRKKEQTQ